MWVYTTRTLLKTNIGSNIFRVRLPCITYFNGIRTFSKSQFHSLILIKIDFTMLFVIMETEWQFCLLLLLNTHSHTVCHLKIQYRTQIHFKMIPLYDVDNWWAIIEHFYFWNWAIIVLHNLKFTKRRPYEKRLVLCLPQRELWEVCPRS